ncbi:MULTISPECIES: UDP-N-acetylmuramoyl-tripeptide--D-alanyl-D-alanine ligase [Actinomyces]|uniref:UDP-N-acetylmuramoyl-tripeptide--D-alanyl-D-alanine ligase n=1 Tax=Actinomyces respiraculi TaxID=2744574 RepID=A0A7T0LMD7_9ACTO|nr:MULTISPECIES: UDP-N-acetylmuramoyl-tripeptide--D-alanyl-D-alanine ligase [Actinomyces]QPL06267.1 UDP-N-acetylmuramoyl-tripeptide--D-alanyl-D-alanine ligase [Actinomyces respiraculi]
MMTRTLCELAAMAGGTLIAPPEVLEEVEGRVVTALVTDSRQAGPGALFVAIAGERTDGHAHVAGVVTQDGVAALVSDLAAARQALAEAGIAPEALPLILVADTVEALGAIARAHLADLRERAAARGEALTVVGITGSVGKTTTKDLTRQLLAAQAPTVAPVASFNNEIGLPLTVLAADESTRYLVLEMGSSGPGHIDYLTALAPLDAAAVLTVGHAHMGGFGTVDGVATAKAEIIRGLLPTGTAVLNLDDPRAAAMAELAPAEVLTFSATGDEAADLRATDVELDAQAHAVLDLHLPGLTAPRRVRLALPGAHNVVNALAAAGLALAAGVEADAVAESLGSARLESPHRMDVHEAHLEAIGGAPAMDLLVIDDAYNANIDSMTASLAALPALAGERRRVVVVSEMLELGASCEADHARTGELAAEAGAALLLTIGPGAAPAADAARSRGIQTVEMPDADAAIALIGSADTPLRDGDAVLVKGSNGSGAWRLADYLSASAKEASSR